MIIATGFSRRCRIFIISLSTLLSAIPLVAQTITLVDFGASKPANTFGLAGWNTLLLSPNMAYSSAGPNGVVLHANFDEFTDNMGVKGSARIFSPGERIVVTWYNNSDQEYSFSARISFNDADQPSGGASPGNWFTMRSFADYRYTYQTILPYSTARTVFNIAGSGIHKSDGLHSLVNINLHIEWFETWPKAFIICDKIELMTDADVSPPGAPAGLSASALSDSKIQLRWETPADNVGVVEYLIYMNGEVEGYSRENSYTAVFLEPGRSYSFAVAALDQIKNESPKSAPVAAATLPYSQAADLINPAGLVYLGAFRLPDALSWGGEAMAYYPHGDGGQSGSGAADGHPGALFVTNLNQREFGFVGQLSIPAPHISATRNIDELPVAQLLHDAVDIRPANVNGWGDYIDIWRTGLTYQAAENRLYSVWSVHYTVTGEKHACLSSCDAANLKGSTKSGAWYIGDPATAPIDAMLGDYLFSTPLTWAAQNSSGRSLVTGRCRDGGLSGLGPTLYAVAPAGARPAAANSVLPFTALLEYGPVAASDYYHFPNSVDGYLLSDSWRDAAWISAGAQNAVMIMGNKARGENWYGYIGERMAHDWVIADEPYPDFYSTDPDGKGWKSQNFIPMAIFYSPDDLAQVAKGVLPSSAPQPYAAKRFNPEIFFGAAREIRTITFDEQNKRLYALEFDYARDGLLIAHVWDVKETVSTIGAVPAHLPGQFILKQNYPNPLNAVTRITYALPADAQVILDIYDVAGRRVGRRLDAKRSSGWHEERLELENLPSGLFFLRLTAGEFSGIMKLVVVK